jgi:phosphoserine phosphatase
VPATTGKVDAIRHFIHPHQRPILVAGDNITDLPMLEYAGDTRLVVDRGVEALRAVALERDRPGERWLIQPELEVDDSASGASTR